MSLLTIIVHIIARTSAIESVGGMYGSYKRNYWHDVRKMSRKKKRHEERRHRKMYWKGALGQWGKKDKWKESGRQWGVKGERDRKKTLIKGCPALCETNGFIVSGSSTVYIWCVSPSICACHAPLLPMHDNYPAADCGDNKKQGSMKWHPASISTPKFFVITKCLVISEVFWWWRM